jgi:hypothetical protein
VRIWEQTGVVGTGEGEGIFSSVASEYGKLLYKELSSAGGTE